MSGSNQGQWMASSITEEDIRKLREARYLTAEIPHRLPAQGQVVLEGVHNLAPNFILNISAFIVMCEAILRIRPHFGLWLKTFNVKPKVVGGEHVECRGAMVSKMPNVTWPEGTFVETVKGWQQSWFYITEPRDAT